jgi:hypothetical protein
VGDRRFLFVEGTLCVCQSDGAFLKKCFWMKNEIVKKRQKTKVMRERD